MTSDLPRRQAEVFAAIRESIRERGYPPTVRELMGRFGIKSPNGVSVHLKALEKKGRIARDGTARGIRLTEPACCPHCGHRLDGKGDAE